MKPCDPGTCFTCRLAGLKDCPDRGARLPLAEREMPVVKNKAFSVKVWPARDFSDGADLNSNGLTEAELERIARFLKDRGCLE